MQKQGIIALFLGLMTSACGWNEGASTFSPFQTHARFVVVDPVTHRPETVHVVTTFQAEEIVANERIIEKATDGKVVIMNYERDLVGNRPDVITATSGEASSSAEVSRTRVGRWWDSMKETVGVLKVRKSPDKPSKRRIIRAKVFGFTAGGIAFATVIHQLPEFATTLDWVAGLALTSSVSTLIGIKEYFSTKYRKHISGESVLNPENKISRRQSITRKFLVDFAVTAGVAVVIDIGPYLLDLVENLPSLSTIAKQLTGLLIYTGLASAFSSKVDRQSTEVYSVPESGLSDPEYKKVKSAEGFFEYSNMIVKQVAKTTTTVGGAILGLQMNADFVEIIPHVSISVGAALAVATQAGFLAYLRTIPFAIPSVIYRGLNQIWGSCNALLKGSPEPLNEPMNNSQPQPNLTPENDLSLEFPAAAA